MLQPSRWYVSASTMRLRADRLRQRVAWLSLSFVAAFPPLCVLAAVRFSVAMLFFAVMTPFFPFWLKLLRRAAQYRREAALCTEAIESAMMLDQQAAEAHARACPVLSAA